MKFKKGNKKEKKSEKNGVFSCCMLHASCFKPRGFTLIEILVAMTLFIIVMTAFINLFISAMQTQRHNINKVYLLNNVSYAAEYMARAIRMAKKDLGGTCVDTALDNFEQPNGNSSIEFLKFEGDNEECINFSLNNGVIELSRSGDNTDGFSATENLTPTVNFVVDYLNFNIANDGQGDQLQPAVTFTIGASTTGNDVESIRIQTTVSQRELDVTY